MCLDGRNQALANGTGVTTYAQTLAADLRRSGRRTEVLLDGRQGSATPGRLSRIARAASPFPARASMLTAPAAGFDGGWMAQDVFRTAQIHFDIYGRLHRVRSDSPPGLMHWTYPLPLAFEGVPNIYTIHDLIPLTHPSLTDIDRQRFKRIVEKVVERADHIVTVSESSRHEIMSLLGVPAEKVTNTYQSVHLPAPDDDTAHAPHCAYFLFCGTIEARKNIVRLIAAYEASGVDTPLILAGPGGGEAAALLGPHVRPLDAMNVTGERGVWRAPWLQRPVLIALFRRARALLFPSLAEGFGLPIAEAMSLGVPVLTSDTGAMAEIAGDAALLVDPTNIAGIAAGIAALDRDAGLRAGLVSRGMRRVAAFTPEKCLARLDAAYLTAGSRPS